MTWADRIVALLLLAAWLMLCIGLINWYSRRSVSNRREFVSRQTLARYQHDNLDNGPR